jgi:hypothetical protein
MTWDKIALDWELVNSTEAAEILGLRGYREVSVYRGRYRTFPEPIVDKGRNCMLWLREDIEKWKMEK